MKRNSKPRLGHVLVISAIVGSSAMTAFVATLTPVQALAAQVGGYVDLVDRVAPAVVYVEVTKKSDESAGSAPSGSFSKEFARRFGIPLPAQPEGDDLEQTGVGTGFIISAEGDIVTNSHVVVDADLVTVKLADGKSLQAEVVGVDPATDLALLRVKAEGALAFVQWGESDALRVGQDVVAIGNPFGLGNTVTAGIVSALGRDINSGPLDDFIQTDAAINRGNSGGPLFNAEGQVVGINTAIFSPSGGSVGIGFAVPSDTASVVIADLADDGEVERGWLGVSIQPVSDDIAAAIGIDEPKGVLITDVSVDTPADKAGLKRGDIVTTIDGTPVDGPRDLMRLVAFARPGTSMDIAILRAGQPSELQVVLGNRTEQPA